MKTTTGKAAEKEMAQMEREAKREKNDSSFDNMNENRGGRKEGGTPDYEKNQSPSTPQEDFDNKKSSW